MFIMKRLSYKKNNILPLYISVKFLEIIWSKRLNNSYCFNIHPSIRPYAYKIKILISILCEILSLIVAILNLILFIFFCTNYKNFS